VLCGQVFGARAFAGKKDAGLVAAWLPSLDLAIPLIVSSLLGTGVYLAGDRVRSL
jgi:hypothetical protein